MGEYSVTEAMVEWLKSLGYDARTRRPADAGGELVTVERTGGPVEDMVDHPSIAVQAWAPTEERAEEMANAIRRSALCGPRPMGVHSLAVDSGPYYFPDESTRLQRYQVVFDATSQLSI